MDCTVAMLSLEEGKAENINTGKLGYVPSSKKNAGLIAMSRGTYVCTYGFFEYVILCVCVI